MPIYITEDTNAEWIIGPEENVESIYVNPFEQDS